MRSSRPSDCPENHLIRVDSIRTFLLGLVQFSPLRVFLGRYTILYILHLLCICFLIRFWFSFCIVQIFLSQFFSLMINADYWQDWSITVQLLFVILRLEMYSILGISIPLSTTIYQSKYHTSTRLAYFCLNIGFPKTHHHNKLKREMQNKFLWLGSKKPRHWRSVKTPLSFRSTYLSLVEWGPILISTPSPLRFLSVPHKYSSRFSYFSFVCLILPFLVTKVAWGWVYKSLLSRVHNLTVHFLYTKYSDSAHIL